MYAIALDIYKNPIYNGCALGGISETFDRVLVECPDGNVEVDPEDPPVNLVRIVQKETTFGPGTPHLEPVTAPPEGHTGWMPGGTLVYTSDSRWGDLMDELTTVPHGMPLALYDRSETWEQSRAMGR